jgi:hypothetical protein
MSILIRPGWMHREIITEGRLHSDELKQRITNLFKRTSLGNSPTYVVGKIAEILRREKGDEVDINEVTDEDIIRIAHCDEVTNGKFAPELKDSIEDARQDSSEEMPEVSDAGLPSEEGEQEETPKSEDMGVEISSDSQSEPESSEDAEEVKSSCDCYKKQSVNTVGFKGPEITKESVKLTSKQVDKLLKENYIKSRQHRFRVEEKYRFF